ncbi:hypothetical protein VE04_00274 [Pseudogymnoascus sp. 24MN13]|nr:hypothetical protein VE04_00274 [Pseudogymnoascus sp. 24MN13]
MATRHSIAQKFLDAEETKLLDLVKAILDQDGYLDDEYMASQYAYSKQAIMLAAYHILLATPSVLLRAIIRGDLPAMSGNYTEVPPRYEFIYPTIYTIYLVDRDTHDPPTVEDLLLIIHSIRQVAGPSAIQRPAMEKALKLCTELEIRMAGQPLRDPIVGGIVDVGFSGDSAALLDQHLADESSNKIMQIFADAAIREFGETYELQGCIVGRMKKLEHCALAEIIFSRMAQSYTSRGGGFNGATAGASIQGAHSLTGVAWEEIAGVAPDWVLTNHYTSDAAKMRAVVQDHHARISRAQAVASHQAIYGRIQGMLSAEESASMDARADAARSAAYSQLAAGDYSEGSEDGTTPADRADETEDDMEDGTVQEDDDEIESYGLAPMMDLGSLYYERDVDPIIDSSDPIVPALRRARLP